jgi:hypothetical protein
MPSISDRGMTITFGLLAAVSSAVFLMLLFDVGATGSQLAFCNAVGCRYTLGSLLMAGLVAGFSLFVFLALLVGRSKRPHS